MTGNITLRGFWCCSFCFPHLTPGFCYDDNRINSPSRSAPLDPRQRGAHTFPSFLLQPLLLIISFIIYFLIVFFPRGLSGRPPANNPAPCCALSPGTAAAPAGPRGGFWGTPSPGRAPPGVAGRLRGAAGGPAGRPRQRRRREAAGGRCWPRRARGREPGRRRRGRGAAGGCGQSRGRAPAGVCLKLGQAVPSATRLSGFGPVICVHS